jgi:hypothetical protein
LEAVCIKLLICSLSLVPSGQSSHYSAKPRAGIIQDAAFRETAGDRMTNLLLASLDEVLAQGERLLQSLSDSQYAAKLPEAGASIGAHYRHSLEHFQLMFEAVQQPAIDYDSRARDGALENERLLAVSLTHDFRHATRFLSPTQLERAIEVRCQTSYNDAAPSTASSTFGREVMYAVSHAMHHYALIALICRLRKIPVPQNFGMAPSTLRYLRQSASA